MKEIHLDWETLSAYSDGELAGPLLADARRHLQACPACPQRLDTLRAASAAVASLPEVSPSPDEHRALRRVILQSRSSSKRFSAGWRWLVAAGTGTAVIAAFAMLFFNRPDPQSETKTTAPAASIQSFDSDEQVRDALAADPQVAAALRRPPGGQAPGLNQRDTGAPEAASAPPGDRADEAATPDQDAPETLDADSSAQFDDPGSCPAKVSAAQTRATVPILHRRVVYKSVQSWMLVYGSPSAPGGPSDQVEAWIVSVQDCRRLSGDALLSAALHYSFFRPS